MKAKKLKKVLVLVLTVVMVMSSASVAAFAETGIAIDSVAVVDGTDGYTPVTNPQVGQKLTANAVLANGSAVGSYPVDANIQYVWSYEGSDTVLGNDPVYTVNGDNLGKTITVTVTGLNGVYSGEQTWTAAGAVENIAISSVAVVDGTDGYTAVTKPLVGQKLTANVVLSNEKTVGSYPRDTDIEYVWSYEGSDVVLGNDPVYTVNGDNLGKTITVTVKGLRNVYSGEQTWTAAGAVENVAISSVAVVDGTDGYTPVTQPLVGQKLTANVVLENGKTVGSYPQDADIEYVWSYEGSDTVLGNDPVYTVTEDNLGKTIAVTVKGLRNVYSGEQSWTATGVVIKEPEVPVTPPSGGGGYVPADTLAADRAAANTAIKDAAAAETYEEAEQAEIQTILDKAAKDIAAAKTADEIKLIKETAIMAIEAIDTAAEKEEIRAIEAVGKDDFIARSKMTTLHGKKAVKVYWSTPKNMEFDGFYVYRSTKRYSGFGTKPFFKTTKKSYINNKDLEAGNTYYYKVKAYKMVNGRLIFTDCSSKAWRTIK